MEDYSAMIRNVFEKGSIRDAKVLFETCIVNAFPTFHFRGLELVRLMREDQYMEGQSWNHVFQVHATTVEGFPVWEVLCRRVTMGKTPDKQVYLDYSTLSFARYKENG